jgi:hypothetical protein
VTTTGYDEFQFKKYTYPLDWPTWISKGRSAAKRLSLTKEVAKHTIQAKAGIPLRFYEGFDVYPVRWRFKEQRTEAVIEGGYEGAAFDSEV